MFRNILVPLDGSPLAERAVSLAAALARGDGARLTLVRAAFVRGFPGIDSTAMQLQEVREAEVYLDGVAAGLARSGLAIETAVAWGEPAEAIVAEVRRLRADLVVMATRGHAGVGRWFHGSVVTDVADRSPVPVLVARAWHTERALVSSGARPRLLVPLDGSPFAEAALPAARALAAALDGELVLVRAVPRLEGMNLRSAWALPHLRADLAGRKVEARTYLRAVAGAHGGLVAACDVRVGRPADVIAAAGREHGAALIVMATHGRAGAPWLAFDGVAAAVLSRGVLPTLLVRPLGLREAERGAERQAARATAGALGSEPAPG